MRPEPKHIIERYYDPDSQAYYLLMTHSRLVADKAIQIALDLELDYTPNLDLIYEAALLHDIGIILTDSPEISCFGDQPYVAHGVLGREILESYGLFKHALICERHLGAGITAMDIRERNLPLPARDMMPLSVEEKIICLADNFYSKNQNTLEKERTWEQVKKRLRKHGEFQIDRLDELARSLGLGDEDFQ